MTPASFLAAVIDPAAVGLLTAAEVPTDDRARILLLAIALQESGLRDRVQINGPAHGWWQFEAGGVQAVRTNRATAGHLRAACAALGVPFETDAIYDAIIYNDQLAFCCARLLLWSDPMPLPAIGDADAAWAYYERNWRPGRPRPDDWPGNYAGAMGALSTTAQPEPARIAGDGEQPT